MASFTAVGNNLEFNVPARGESVAIALSGTYDMTIELQREQGSPGSGSWAPIKQYTVANATVADTFVTTRKNETLRLIVLVDNSGTCTATMTDASDLQVDVVKDEQGNTIIEATQAGAAVTGTLAVSGATTLSGALTVAAAAVVLRMPDSAPLITKYPVPSTGTTSTAMSEAELLGGVHVKTPTAAQNFQVPTGTEIDAALLAATGIAVAAGDTFDFALVNLGGAGDIITLTVDTGVTFVGSVTLDDAGADINSSGIWRFRQTSAAVWVATRIA